MAFSYPFWQPADLVGVLAPGSMMLRFLMGGAILLYAVWTDLMHRRVKNEVWVVTLVIAALLGLYDIFYGSPPLAYFVYAPIVMAVAYFMWRLRLLFGGADAKCVMAYALLVPFPPALVTSAGAVYPHLPAFLPLAVTMLTNAVVFTLAIPVAYFFLNLSRGHMHPAAMFLGTRMPLERVFTEPVWVMDWVKPAPGAADDVEEGPSLADTTEDPDLDDDGLPHVDRASLEGARVKLVYMPTRAGDYALNLARLRALDIKTVWATPKVPFMIPLALGFVTAFIVGDLITAVTLWAAGGL